MSKLIPSGVRIQSLNRLRTVGALVLFGIGVMISGTSARAGEDDGFNKKGHIVIADQFNNRVIEIDPATHKVVWQFGDGSSVPGPHSIVGTNDAERYGELTLISGTGIPMTNPPTLPGCPPPVEQTVGCPDNRVILVNEDKEIIWQYGQDGGASGSGFDELNTPVAATVLPNGHFLITDQLNERVIEVNREKEIVWQYGMTGVIGSGFNQLSNPNSAELLKNGHILIADENNNRAIEVDRDYNIINTYTAGGSVSGVAFASRLKNGNTLLTDSNNSRIVEVDASDTIVWQFVTTTQSGSIPAPLPTRAVRLRNGNTLISDQFNNVVIEVDHEVNPKVVFTQGQIGPVGGNGFNQLNGPYDAKVIGDFTGLTPPPED